MLRHLARYIGDRGFMGITVICRDGVVGEIVDNVNHPDALNLFRDD